MERKTEVIKNYSNPGCERTQCGYGSRTDDDERWEFEWGGESRTRTLWNGEGHHQHDEKRKPGFVYNNTMEDIHFKTKEEKLIGILFIFIIFSLFSFISKVSVLHIHSLLLLDFPFYVCFIHK